MKLRQLFRVYRRSRATYISRRNKSTLQYYDWRLAPPGQRANGPQMGEGGVQYGLNREQILDLLRNLLRFRDAFFPRKKRSPAFSCVRERSLVIVRGYRRVKYPRN